MKRLILTILPILVLTGCSASNTAIKKNSYYFDTFQTVSLYENKTEAFANIDQIFSDIDEISDNYSTSNILYELNNTQEEIEIPKELYDLLRTSQALRLLTNGYFNPLVGSLSKKWKDALTEKKTLTEEEIQTELHKIDSTSLSFKELDDKYYAKKSGEAQIDFGAIAKGYSLDMVHEYLINNKINQYLIDNGSSSILLGEKPSKDGLFNITLNIPGLENTYYIQAKNTFIGASGISEQGVEIDNVIYSHIVNPFTGSVINNYDYSLVLGNNGALCDVLATAFMMMDISEIQEIVKQQHIEVLLYKNKKLIYQSDNIVIKKW